VTSTASGGEYGPHLPAGLEPFQAAQGRFEEVRARDRRDGDQGSAPIWREREITLIQREVEQVVEPEPK
jgi:hypothetical protein